MTESRATTPQPYQHRLHPGDHVDPRNHGLGGDSDRQRLLDTFAGRATDRRPTLEYLIDRRSRRSHASSSTSFRTSLQGAPNYSRPC